MPIENLENEMYQHHHEEEHMSNVYDRGMSVGGEGFGGGGTVTGFLLASLLDRSGLGGYGHGDSHGCCEKRCATTDDVLDINQLDKLGDIQAAIPIAGLKVESAIAAANYATNSALTAQSNLLQTSFMGLGMSVQKSFYDSARDMSGGFSAVTAAVVDQGEKTRALIAANNLAEVERERDDLQTQLAVERARHNDAAGRHSLEINQTVNQNQNQQQFNALFAELRDMKSRDQYAQYATNLAFNVGGLQNSRQNSTNAQI